MRVIHAKHGDRWDLIAYDIYGDASLVSALMAANASFVDLENTIPEGTEIILPDIQSTAVKTTQITAPWKR